LAKAELSAAELQQAAERIKSLRRSATEQAIEIGRELLRVKESVAHGAFVRWVEKSCEFKIRTAQNLMRLARDTEPSSKLIALMVPSTLRVYLSKTTPAPARNVILKRLQNGDYISRKELYSEVMSARADDKARLGDGSERRRCTPSLFAGAGLVEEKA